MTDNASDSIKTSGGNARPSVSSMHTDSRGSKTIHRGRGTPAEIKPSQPGRPVQHSDPAT